MTEEERQAVVDWLLRPNTEHVIAGSYADWLLHVDDAALLKHLERLGGDFHEITGRLSDG